MWLHTNIKWLNLKILNESGSFIGSQRYLWDFLSLEHSNLLSLGRIVENISVIPIIGLIFH